MLAPILALLPAPLADIPSLLPALLAQAAPAAETGKETTSAFIIQMVGIGLLFYFLLIYPQRKQSKERAALLAAAKTGDKVIVGEGIHGIIANVKETTVIVKVADNVKMEFEKSALKTVIKSDKEKAEEAEEAKEAKGGSAK